MINNYGGLVVFDGKNDGQVEGTNLHMRCLTKLANGDWGIKEKGKWFTGNMPLERKVLDEALKFTKPINGYYVVKEGYVIAEHVTDYKKRRSYIQAYQVVLIIDENAVLVPISI